MLPKEREPKASCFGGGSENNTGAILAAVTATLGSFMFGFNIGFTSPALHS